MNTTTTSPSPYAVDVVAWAGASTVNEAAVSLISQRLTGQPELAARGVICALIDDSDKEDAVDVLAELALVLADLAARPIYDAAQSDLTAAHTALQGLSRELHLEHELSRPEPKDYADDNH